MKNFSFEVKFKDEDEFKRNLEEIFRFIYGVNRQCVACFRFENKIKVCLKLNDYKEDEIINSPIEDFKKYLKITRWSETLEISNVTGWEKTEEWKEVYESQMQAGACMVFWLGCSFPYDFCQKLKMTVCEMPREDFKEAVKKYKVVF